MKSSSPLWLLGALGALTISVGTPAWAVDPSQWTCETCPFEDAGTHGSVDIGVGGVKDRNAAFGNYTGLDQHGAFVIAGGDVKTRTKSGFFGSASATGLGLDTRSLNAELGQEGRYTVRLGYAQIPHRLSDTAQTPFLGVGGTSLTLPAGFPAATTSAMPLDSSTLQTVDLGTKRSRLDLSASLYASDHWTTSVAAHHTVRDGLLRTAGSFFSTTSQLTLPVDQTTDEFEATAAYTTQKLQASLGYRASLFRNADDGLTWQNPFTAPVAGATSGQLALAPDNQFHQWTASVGYQLTPATRASAELALGRMTQDSAYLATTLNSTLAVPALPANSLHGSADTLDASVRISTSATERLRLSASLTRNERDNNTPSLAYPAVSTDMFLGADTRVNQPYSFTRDRLKLAADYRGPGSAKLAAGAEQDNIQRTLQETDTTRESTVWVRGSVRARENIALSVKLAHAERDSSGYNVVAAIQPPENPLLRKYNLADRQRNSGTLRADFSFGERVTLGVAGTWADDDYRRSVVGLTNARSSSLETDVSFAISDATQLRAYAQTERLRSAQTGSQQASLPDWTGTTKDSFEVLGLGLTHSAMKGKLELGGDVTFSRSRSDIKVATGASAPAFPTNKTSLDNLKLFANYKLKDKLTLLGSYEYESVDTRDWHLDTVLPASVPNLLAFGELPPHYHASVLRLALRYRF